MADAEKPEDTSASNPAAATDAASNAAPTPAPAATNEAAAKTEATDQPSVPEVPAAEAKQGTGASLFDADKLKILNDVGVVLSIEIGRAQLKIRDLLNLNKGAIIELDKLAGEPVDVYANGKLISKGNIITANGRYCVRLTSINENNKPGATPDGK